MNTLKAISLLLIINFNTSLSFGQTKTIDFLNAENEAHYIHLFKNDYSQSIVEYKKIVNDFPEYAVISEKLYLYIESGLKNNEFGFIFKIYKERLKRGLDTSLYVDKNYKNFNSLEESFFKFKKSKLWQKEIDKVYKKTFNIEGKYKIPNSDKLNKAINEANYLNGFDQGVRNALHIQDEKFTNDPFRNELSKLLDNKLRERDSLNFKEFIKIIKVLNNTREQIKIFYSAYAVVIHNFKYCKIGNRIDSSDYFYIKQVLYNGLINNEMRAQNYAMFIDKSLIYRGNNDCINIQRYGTATYKNSNKETITNLYTIEDIKNIDLIRAEIGLPTLYEASLEYKFKLPENYKIPEKYLTLNRNDINNFR
jgi:hypothetical protein